MDRQDDTAIPLIKTVMSQGGETTVEATSIGDRAHFKRTIETRDFSLGDYQIGRVTGKANIGFGFPNFDPKDDGYH